MTLTAHAGRIFKFMAGAKQATPATPAIPDERTRILRAKLIFEEALETVEALGVAISDLDGREIKMGNTVFQLDGEPNLVEIADGCADVSVVTIGTLIACGIADRPVLECIDASNLSKLDEGHSFREDGKLLKSPNFKKPDLTSVLRAQGWTG